MPSGASADQGDDLTASSLEELASRSVLTVNHTHGDGEFMVGYALQTMDMQGNRRGSKRIKPREVLDDFMITPLNMSMSMQMLHLMYAANDWFTVMVMPMWMSKSMRHRTRMGMEFTTESKGLGDTDVVLIPTLYNQGSTQLFSNLGVGVPTGSIEKLGTTPMGSGQRLPYPMQLGSGTWDVIVSAHYASKLGKMGVGGDLRARIRTGENSEGYRLGHQGDVAGWASWDAKHFLTIGAKLSYFQRGNIEGEDSLLNPAMVPTADPERQAKKNLLAGAMVYLHKAAGLDDDLNVVVEASMPVWRDLDGPQLQQDWNLLLRLEWVHSPALLEAL
jgi:hypothetical protein